jgi:hypothetical protein
MSRRTSSDDVMWTLAGIVALVFFTPKWVWIPVIALPVVVVIAYWIYVAVDNNREEARARARRQGAARAAAAQREREEREAKAAWEKQRRIDTLGWENAALVESALKSANQVAASEAARAGWLPDVDFGPDIKWITAKFEKAHRLRLIADELRSLESPSVDERKNLADARTNIANFERPAIERVELIGTCAKRAQLIDESLRNERRDAQVATKRAELSAKLSAELYGIEATPDTAPTRSAVDAVIARVEAYQEIRSLIQRARDIAP